MSADTEFDIAIVGGALVGAAAARALAGERIALLSQESAPTMGGTQQGFDARVYAISPGNAAFLARLGAWSVIPAEHLTPVHAMRVHGDDGDSAIEFDSYRSGVSELAWIVEDRRLQEALWRGLETQERLSLHARAPIRELRVGEREARLALQDGRELSALLVIGADGARSLVREQTGIASAGAEYGQTAVVANFACARAHRNVAWQWFRGAAEGGAILALLPLPGDHVSMVWSVPGVEAQRLLALDGETLAREVGAASGHALGELSLVTAARGFPLRRLAAGRMVAPRVALAGDAAHVVHPLAGQGANLGLLDAAALADVLAAGIAGGEDPGALRILRRYERWRRSENELMSAAIDAFDRLLARGSGRIADLAQRGMPWVGRSGVLKRAFIERAMGLAGELPAAAR